MSDGKVSSFIYFIGGIPLPNLHKIQDAGRKHCWLEAELLQEVWISSIYCDCAKKCSVAINYSSKRGERGKSDFLEDFKNSKLGMSSSIPFYANFDKNYWAQMET